MVIYQCSQTTYMNLWVTTSGHYTTGRTVSMENTPQSCAVQTPSGEIYGNQSQQNMVPSDTETSTKATRSRSSITTHSWTGAAISPPERLVA